MTTALAMALAIASAMILHMALAMTLAMAMASPWSKNIDIVEMSKFLEWYLSILYSGKS